ncbi:hypothetical protein GOODEAATRI_013990, partial [Goodea atripinnis]
DFWTVQTRKMSLTVSLLLVALCANGGYGEEGKEAQRTGHVSVVIVGGTGDLARKYLWQGFFQLYVDQVSGGNTFSFYGGGLSPSEKATPILFEILKAVTCSKDVSQERCAILKDQFLRLSQYRQLKALEDYQELAKHIEQQLQQEGMTEAGRLFYLSVPAFTYAGIAEKINSSCRPADGSWLKVVLEKPFGHNYRSAQVLATELLGALKDEEMYRIDHYLGKQVDRAHHVPVPLDISGRIAFYDEYGVIRDVLQNHLTEVMALLTMKLPANVSNSGEVLRNKLEVLSSMLPLGKNQAVIGQYQNYKTEVQQDKNLFKPALTGGEWKEVTEHKDVSVLGLQISDYYVQTPTTEREAYAELVSHIFAGQKNNFVSTENLLASWEVWTPLLSGLKGSFPRIYPGGADNGDMLDIHLRGKELRYSSEVVIISPDKMGGTSGNSFQVMQGKFRNAEMVSAWTEELVERLAADMQEAAEAAVQESGVFHLALSGGSTPIALFHRLVLHHFSFPWRDTHVWMVDERCVPLTEMESNFHSMHEHLLHHVKIPYYNIHPMPVQLNQRLCVEEDGGAQLYEKEINKLVNGSSFHFVLLGVGYDGHTASLFPGGKLNEPGESLVALTESPIKPHQRMSLTFGAINRAHTVALLVMGKGKHELVTQLSRVQDNLEKYPVTGVKPANGRLVWYMDYDALLG